MRKSKNPTSRSIAVEFDGKSYSATYSVDSKVVSVECPLRFAFYADRRVHR